MPIWRDKTIWSADELQLRSYVQKLFKSNYSRDEIKYLVDKALFSLCLCDWTLTDIETMQLLEISKPAFIRVRDSLCFTRELSYKKTIEDEEASAYFKKKILPQREMLRKQIEIQRLRELAMQAENEQEERVDDSLCADDRLKT